jgi:hypothetical protein
VLLDTSPSSVADIGCSGLVVLMYTKLWLKALCCAEALTLVAASDTSCALDHAWVSTDCPSCSW